jgi:hypothetical protein
VSSSLFQRRVEVTLGKVLVKGDFRIGFNVHKTTKEEPNTLDLEINNLAEKTRGALRMTGEQVVLSAGYADSFGILFSGDARTIDHQRQGTDWVTRVQCGDGERAYQYARFGESFKPGVLIKDVILAVARKTGLGIGNLEEALVSQKFRGNITQFVHGFSDNGPAFFVFRSLMKTVGWQYSIQHGQIQILKNGKDTISKAVLLTPETGLIGSPTFASPPRKGGLPVLKIRSLLQPKIVPGGIVEVHSETANGQFRVESVDHTGDSYGGDWYSDVEGRVYA